MEPAGERAGCGPRPGRARCGGAAAYRQCGPVPELGGFDETLCSPTGRTSTWRCASGKWASAVLATAARALHKHGQTLGAASPAARRLEAFGRGYVLAKYRVGGRNPLRWAKIAALDWPVLAVHLVLRRETGPARERLRARSLGLARPRPAAPLELATVGFGTALRRQADLLRHRFLRRPAGSLLKRRPVETACSRG